MGKRSLSRSDLSESDVNKLRAEVTRDIALGFSPYEAAKNHNVPHYFAWECQRIYQGLRSDTEAVVQMTVAMLDGLREEMEAMRAVTTDVEWLRLQKAGDLAKLNDSLSDRYFKILGAFVAGRQDGAGERTGEDGRQDGRSLPTRAGDGTAPVEVDDAIPVPADTDESAGIHTSPPSPKLLTPRCFMA